MRNKLFSYSIVYFLLPVLTAGMLSCRRDTVGILNTGNFTDTSGALKTASSGGMLIGLESDYPAVTSNPVYLATIAREANMTTFGYEMKHGAIVQNDGSFNYSNTDNQYNAVSNAGLKVFGHNLCWYQNQNATFLNSVVGSSASAAPSPATARSVDSLLQLWIAGPNGIAAHYAGKVIAWDVVNEPMSDGTGGVRTSQNTTIPSPKPKDWFFWSDFLGRDYALNAFQYAKLADPNALLFINEYNLETNTAKLDSLIAYVKELQGMGAKIDGIGTEMHIAINTPYAGIDAAFKALAATGLKVRISELDVRLNPNNKTGFTTLPVDPTLLASQANMYRYVVSSYMKNVPAAQRFGITVWGVDDPDSWILTSQGNQDAPLLFNGGFSKKPAYAGFLQGLKGI